MKYMGHTVQAMPHKRIKDGQLYAYVDGRLDRSIEPSPYRGVIFRRIKKAYQDKFKQETGSVKF